MALADANVPRNHAYSKSCVNNRIGFDSGRIVTFVSNKMPNRNRRGNRDRGFKGGGHSEHDDRTAGPSGGGGGRHVKFKPARDDVRSRMGVPHRKWGVLRFPDPDIDMGGGRGGPDQQVYTSRKDVDLGAVYLKVNRRKNNEREKRLFNDSPASWYKVILRYGNKYDRDTLLKVLANYTNPIPLLPFCYRTDKEGVSFLIGDRAAAMELLDADRKITMQDGWKLWIQVRSINPYVEVDEKLSSAIKRAMSARYNSYNKSLSLEKFHTDPTFAEEALFCPLNRPNVMLAVMDIIGEVIPDLLALDLSQNKLVSLDHLKILLDKAPHLRTLFLAGNKLRDIKQLDPLKGLPLEEISLDGNSLCDKFNEKDTYIRAVRQRFPKVIKLDSVDLPPPILFGTEDEGRLPTTKASFMADPAGADIVRQFLEQYYQLYDSSVGRPSLGEAYHPQATFSLDVSHNPNEPQGLGAYLSRSRNLSRVSSLPTRVSLLKTGREAVVATLMDLPATTHDPASFLVDLVLFLPQLIEVSVCGVFKETSSNKKTHYRAFSRVFIIVPHGSGFCILNEQLTVLPATQEQIKKAFKAPQPVVAPGGEVGAAPPQQSPLAAAPPPLGAVASPLGAVAPPLAAVAPDLAAKQQMVTELSAKTGMNLIWSEKCLVETNWNFEAAVYAFSVFHKQGSIPEEAFVK